jgi:SAM-dependent methyltransferase
MKKFTKEKTYYRAVKEYYDSDASDFEKRYWLNPILRRIRQSFREETKLHTFNNALEIGCGPGFDLVHFAQVFDEKQWFGIDISPEMTQLSQNKIEGLNLKNASVAVGSVEDVELVFPNQKFDLIFVFFGALNTVSDLKNTAKILDKLLTSDGKMVLTFVNKWFIQGIAIELLKGKPKSAFSRLGKIWGGYSPTKHLDSTCYSRREIKEIFSSFHLKAFRGYSIFYPAWYYQKIYKLIPNSIRHKLWNLDSFLGPSWLGQFGEYACYTFEKRTHE